MPERIPQSATIRVPLQAYLSSDHVTPATSKTIAITISKNGAAYGNPSAGATNATEIASGSYYVDLSTTDTGTTGPLFVLGTATGVDNVVAIYDVVKATNGGLSALPDTACTTNNSLITSGTSTDQLQVTSGLASSNAKQINSVATTSVTTVSAYLGTTQPLNFTGTGASALVKSDMVDIAGAAVSTSTAQIGVNAVNWAGGAIPAPNVTGVPLTDVKYSLGTLSAGAAGYFAPDWGHVNAQSTVVDLSNTTIKGTDSAVSANVTAWLGTGVSANVAGIPLVDTGYIKGTASAGAAGYVGTDQSKITNPTATVNLSGTTISTSQVVASVTGAVGSVTAPVTVGGYSAGEDPFSLVWNATDGLELGITTLQGLRYIASASAGVLSGAASTTVAIQAIGNPATNRITATVDASGDRTAVTLS